MAGLTNTNSNFGLDFASNTTPAISYSPANYDFNWGNYDMGSTGLNQTGMVLPYQPIQAGSNFLGDIGNNVSSGINSIGDWFKNTPWTPKPIIGANGPTGGMSDSIFGTAAGIADIGAKLWGAWNTMKAGKIAEEAMKNNLALGRAGAQFGLEQARDIKVAREARNQASTGQLNRQQAYANAERAIGYKTLADYGL
jgi:hypothetical protein